MATIQAINSAQSVLGTLLALLMLAGNPISLAADDAKFESSPAPGPVPQDGNVHRDGPDAMETKPEKERFRLLPIPILITEPAIGEGIGLTLALFHPVKQGKVVDTRIATPESIAEVPDSRAAPPVVTAVAGAYTNNDTWFAGLGHVNNWRNDAIRYTGALAKARVNSRIYLLNLPVRFSMETDLIFQELTFRIGHSDFMLGGGLIYLDARNRFGLGQRVDEEDERFALDFKDIAVSAKLAYETRDNIMNPTSGQLVELAVLRYDEAFGGSFDYWSWKAKALSFHSLTQKLTLGLRLQFASIGGKPPFFAYPYVKLRGIPALRYQDKMAGVAEIEGRYLLAPRWEVSAFTGLGYVSDDIPLFDNPDKLYNFGVGARYKVFDAHNVWLGIDVARGPEDWNYYVQVGQAW